MNYYAEENQRLKARIKELELELNRQFSGWAQIEMRAVSMERESHFTLKRLGQVWGNHARYAMHSITTALRGGE